MKKILVVALVVAVTLIGASVAMASIKDSAHDLSTSSTSSLHLDPLSGTSVSACQFCHTPHLGTWSPLAGVPLWNRTVGSGSNASDGSTGIIVYGAAVSGNTGTTLSGSQVDVPGPNSRTCLSCHDGTLAMSSVHVGDNSGLSWTGANSGDQTAGMLNNTSGALIGTNLNTSHPVGVKYDSGVTSAGLNGSVVDKGSFGTIGTTALKIYGGGNTVGTVECGSCHDPHGSDSVAGGPNAPFLKGSRATICTDCHSSK